MMGATCSSCGAPIVWATIDGSGKACPFDAAPVKVYAIFTPPGGKPRAMRNPQPHFRSHFETCPDAQRHSRKPGKGDTLFGGGPR